MDVRERARRILREIPEELMQVMDYLANPPCYDPACCSNDCLRRKWQLGHE